ncbi:hypothetical protein N7532_001316 [Penicillium argentinense]|uniref:IEC3 subunit of the Ino80 complex, chromatin re-modelling-domain-containing protein n=1 Tax=Penicillium argentinense TaxID=1131581 RepID=A0A9W9G2H2_9EURO|nr:uncharacterized protein N7532_001316 [Penicillium argentinense]KAJ5110781.1 hypothetical protein N7532_001316 [Penicillium argentinense]
MEHEPTETTVAMGTLPDAPAGAPAKPAVRSFKKKYAKMKVKFEQAIRENEHLIREELRIEDLSKRIQQQNDQILETLLELNDSLQIPPAIRYELSMPGDISFDDIESPVIQPLIDDTELAWTALKEAKEELARGDFAASAYRRIEESIKRNKDFAPKLQYSTLHKIPHGAAIQDEQRIAHDVERNLGYFTAEREDEYDLATDAKLGDEAAAAQLARIPDPPTLAEREKDAFARNPASVSNWLRRNQPQTLQDHEAASEKSTSRPSNQRASKRAPAQRKDEETIDEDGMDVEPTPKNKRKRDDDTGYRPKGGNNRSKKKKEESTPTANRNAKKA